MDRFTTKLGGLPVWVWALIVGLVFVAVMYWSKLRTAPLNAPTAAAPYDMLGGESQLGSSGIGSGALSGDPVSEFVSNATWEAQGVALLSGQGVSPFAAQTALEHYINGDPMTPTELEWVNRVIASKGLPPQGNAALSELVDAVTGRTPSQEAEWQGLQAERNAADAATRAAADQAAAAQRAQQEQSAAAAAAAAAQQAAAQQDSTIKQWLDALRYHSWQLGPEETAVFQASGRMQEALDAKHDYDLSRIYLANFRRPQGWQGPNADAARIWLTSHGYPTK